MTVRTLLGGAVYLVEFRTSDIFCIDYKWPLNSAAATSTLRSMVHFLFETVQEIGWYHRGIELNRFLYILLLFKFIVKIKKIV